MSEQIQQARDVLAEWRDGLSPNSWSMSAMKDDGDWTVWSGQGAVATVHGWEADTQTIVGIAGKPAMLDLIDLLFHCALGIQRSNAELVDHAQGIAAAILSADEQMSA